jgi:hypothetical protein
MALLNVDKLSVHFGDEGTPFRAVDRISVCGREPGTDYGASVRQRDESLG